MRLFVPMRVTIRQKNLEITPALREYIEMKVLKPLRRLIKPMLRSELPILDLEFSRTTLHHRKGKVYYAEANLSLGKKMLRVSVEDEDIRAACDLLEEELKRIIMDLKNRTQSLEKRRARRIKEELRFSKAAGKRR